MSAAIETRALTACIRDTLDIFLADHEGLRDAAVAVDWDGQHCIFVEVEGFGFTLTLGDARRNPWLDEPDQ